MFGLWKVCSPESNTCKTMDELTEMMSSLTSLKFFPVDEKLKVVRAFIIMGIISSVSSLVVTCLNVVGKIEMFKDFKKLSVLQGVTFCYGLIALSVYTAYFIENEHIYEQRIAGIQLNTKFSVGWAYIAGCIGTALAAITAFFSCIL